MKNYNGDKDLSYLTYSNKKIIYLDAQCERKCKRKQKLLSKRVTKQWLNVLLWLN